MTRHQSSLGEPYDKLYRKSRQLKAAELACSVCQRLTLNICVLWHRILSRYESETCAA